MKMVKKCIYCSCEIDSESVIDFCRKCGVGVWGEKMFDAILENMENARERGDLCNSRTPLVEKNEILNSETLD